MDKETRWCVIGGLGALLLGLVIATLLVPLKARDTKIVCNRTAIGTCPMEKPETKAELVRELSRVNDRVNKNGGAPGWIIEFRTGLKTTHKTEEVGPPWYRRTKRVTVISGGTLVGTYGHAQVVQLLTRLGEMPSPDSLVLTGDGYPPKR